MADDEEDLDVEFVPDEQIVVEGEASLHPSINAICERFGLLGVTLRDGFLYVYSLEDGEVLFSDFLKHHRLKGATLTAIGSKRRQ